MARRAPTSVDPYAEQQIADLLRTAKDSLHLSVAFLSRLDGETQHLEVVEATGPASLFFRTGVTQRQETSPPPQSRDADYAGPRSASASSSAATSSSVV